MTYAGKAAFSTGAAFFADCKITEVNPERESNPRTTNLQSVTIPTLLSRVH